MPRNATTSSRGQRYYSWRGERYWSVTTIRDGGIPQSWALKQWAPKFVANYAIEHRETLNVLAADDPAAAVEWLRNSPWRERDAKMELGSHMHAAIEAHVLGKPYPKPPDPVAAKLRGFHKFLEDFQPVFEATEASVYNRTEHYAGTLDYIVGMLGGAYILDAKSGKRIYPETAVQLAAYRRAEFIGLPDGSEAPMPETDGAFGLFLDDDYYELVPVDTGDRVFNTFLYAREMFRWQEELSKQVLGPPVQPPAEGTPAPVIAFGKQALQMQMGEET
jgi:hypothetical protein